MMVDKVQGGFRTERGCSDHIFTDTKIVEKTTEKDKKMYMAFFGSRGGV